VRRPLDDEPQSIAVVRLRTGLGDLLCTVPALRALRARLPEVRVALITFAEMRDVVDRMRPWVDELMSFPGHPGIPERPVRWSEIAPFYAAARTRRFDLALQMYGANPAANEVTERLGARRTGGFFVPGTRDPDRSTHVAYPGHEHEVRRHLTLMRHLGADPPVDSRAREALSFPRRAADRTHASRLAAASGLETPYALIHPGATSPSRRWAPERFAAVGDALRRRGLQIGIVGTGVERPLALAVLRAMRAPAVDLCGRTGLGALAALLADARLLVGNDSGPAHLAAAVGTPSVTLFLSGDPVRWAYGSRRHRVARVQVECNPCPHLRCPIDHRCASRLQVARVLAEVDAVLDSTMPPCSSSLDRVASI
jgi:ADP-heptose:LPS heptosyltransferase